MVDEDDNLLPGRKRRSVSTTASHSSIARQKTKKHLVDLLRHRGVVYDDKNSSSEVVNACVRLYCPLPKLFLFRFSSPPMIVETRVDTPPVAPFPCPLRNTQTLPFNISFGLKRWPFSTAELNSWSEAPRRGLSPNNSYK